jgi:hypothetical protein
LRPANNGHCARTQLILTGIFSNASGLQPILSPPEMTPVPAKKLLQSAAKISMEIKCLNARLSRFDTASAARLRGEKFFLACHFVPRHAIDSRCAEML